MSAMTWLIIVYIVLSIASRVAFKRHNKAVGLLILYIMLFLAIILAILWYTSPM